MPLIRARRAADISVVPTGDVIAKKLQDAIAELASEKLAVASNLSDLADKIVARNNLGAEVAGAASIAIAAHSSAIDPHSQYATNADLALKENTFNVLSINKGGTGSNTQNFVDLTSSQTVGGNKAFSGLVSTSGGSVTLDNATSNLVNFGTVGIGTPTVSTRSTGTKIVLFSGLSATTVDHAIGVNSLTTWYSVPQPVDTNSFVWYGGTTELMRLTGSGQLNVLSRIVNRNYEAGSNTGTNVAGFFMEILGGRGTGTGSGGSISLSTYLPNATSSNTPHASYNSRLFISGSNARVGIHTTTPGCALQINGGVAIASSGAAAVDPGAGNLSVAGGSIGLSNTTSNIINWNTFGQANPTFSGSGRSAGTKLVLRSDLSSGQTDTAIGVGFSGSNSTLWMSVPQSVAAAYFSWFGGTSEIARLSGDRSFNLFGTGSSLTVAGTAASTSATTGALVVAGGVGIGAALNVGGNISSDSFNLSSKFLLRQTATKTTTNNTSTELFLDAGNSQRLTLTNDTTWHFRIFIAAQRTDASEGGTIEISGCVRRGANAASTTIPSLSKISHLGALTWDGNVSADLTNGALKLEVIGAAGATINWNAAIQILQAN